MSIMIISLENVQQLIQRKAAPFVATGRCWLQRGTCRGCRPCHGVQRRFDGATGQKVVHYGRPAGEKVG